MDRDRPVGGVSQVDDDFYMIEDQKILAIIPARGGSKGVLRKNIRIVSGKPLIAWTIEEAKKSKYIDRLILSSDDSEIIEIASQMGCEVPFIRPKELATDDTPGVIPVLHALERIDGYNIAVLLQPTSPLRNVEDIDGCIKHFIVHGANSCVSISKTNKHPNWMFTVNKTGFLRPVVKIANAMNSPRQELDSVFMLNGAIYVAKVEWLKLNRKFIDHKTLGYVMPHERSLDIDTEDDLGYFRFLKEVCLEKKTNSC